MNHAVGQALTTHTSTHHLRTEHLPRPLRELALRHPLPSRKFLPRAAAGTLIRSQSLPNSGNEKAMKQGAPQTLARVSPQRERVD